MAPEARMQSPKDGDKDYEQRIYQVTNCSLLADQKISRAGALVSHAAKHIESHSAHLFDDENIQQGRSDIAI